MEEPVSESKLATQRTEISSSDGTVAQSRKSMHLVVKKTCFALNVFAQLGKLSNKFFYELGGSIHMRLYA
jgi:hypothetical protein